MRQPGEPQGFRGFPIFQQPRLFLQGLFLPGGQGFRPLHHFSGLVADKALVIRAGFGCLHLVGPGAGAPGGLLEALDVLPEPVVFRLLELLLTFKILPPGAVVSALDLNIRPIQRQNVIHAVIQKAAVVGDQDKAPLPPEIGGGQRPALGVQVVGGFVNQREAPLP